MRKPAMIAAAALVAAFPLMIVSAGAQSPDRPGGGGGGGARSAPAPSAPAAAPAPAGPSGGGGPAFGGGRGGMGGGGVAIAPRPDGGGRIGPQAGPGPSPGGWSGPRPGWDGRRHGWHGRHHHHHHRHYGSGFGTGLWLGGAYAASPYSYDYYDEPAYVYETTPYAYGDGVTAEDIAACRQRYRSYDVRSRTYLNNDGNRYPCP